MINNLRCPLIFLNAIDVEGLFCNIYDTPTKQLSFILFYNFFMYVYIYIYMFLGVAK